MKKTALLLATITLFSDGFSAENVSFRDGTFLTANIFREKGFEPNGDGVILTVEGKVYLHHYPCTQGSRSVPTYYYNGPNPYGISNCSPTRISFFHFETFSLLGMRDRVSRMNIPVKKKVEAIKAINRAMSLNPPNVMTSPTYKNKGHTKKWQRWCEVYVGRRFEIGQVVWGKDLESLKKKNLVNKGRAFAKK